MFKMERETLTFVLLLTVSLLLLATPKPAAQYASLSLLSPAVPLKEFASDLWFASKSIVGVEVQEGTPTGSVWEELKRENDFLRGQVIKLTSENIELKEQLHSLSQFRDTVSDRRYITLFADVVLSSDTSGWRRSVVVSRGSSDGIEIGMPVVWENHLVGRISGVSNYTSRVSLLTDAGFKTGAVPLQRYPPEQSTFAKRDIGIIEGNSDASCSLNWITRETKVSEGWLVVTAGDELVGIPKNLIVGRIDRINPDKGPYYSIAVTPLVKFENLEYLMILKRQ